MTSLKLLCLSAVVAGATALPVAAQTAPPTSPPPASRPDAAPMPQTPPAVKPAPRTDDKSATAPIKNPLVGLAVFSADGSKLGNVQSVRSGPDGKAMAIHIKTGGFLGLGGKLVAIADGKFTKTGDRVQLSLTAEEVSKLPEVKDNG